VEFASKNGLAIYNWQSKEDVDLDDEKAQKEKESSSVGTANFLPAHPTEV
jgi:hypothetical protein